MSTNLSTQKQQRLFQFSSGGWVVLAAVVLTLTITGWYVKILLSSVRSHAVGDGTHIDTYGFDFSICRIPKNEIIASGMPKDGLPVLDNPSVMTAEDVDELNRKEHSHYLISTDRVLGVEINEEKRAYPLRVLNWHEIINDTLGGRAILVTYNPLCDSAVVYERKVGDEILEFGCSGLLYNSNTLMYDRRLEAKKESLWSQLVGKAISGPAAGENQKLTVIPMALVGWRTWRTLHPDTTVLYPQPKMRERYMREYGNYFGSDLLRFPVHLLPPEKGIPKKTPLILIGVEGLNEAYSYSVVKNEVDTHGDWITFIRDVPIRFHCYSDPFAVTVQSLDSSIRLEVRYAFWFAWYAINTETEYKF